MLMQLQKSGKLWKWVICDHHDWSSFIFPKFLFDLSPYMPLTTQVAKKEGYQQNLNIDLKTPLDRLV